MKNPFTILGLFSACMIAIVVLIVGGCTAQPTLAELESEAMVTGDWTHFDRKNKRHLERAAYVELTEICDARGRIVHCVTRGTRMTTDNCTCGRRR